VLYNTYTIATVNNFSLQALAPHQRGEVRANPESIAVGGQTGERLPLSLDHLARQDTRTRGNFMVINWTFGKVMV
jgi:hypothetical protein